MSNDVSIPVEGLGKKYRNAHQAERQRYVALRDVIAQKCAAPFRALFQRGAPSPPRPGESDATLAHRMGEGLGVRASGEVSNSPLPSPLCSLHERRLLGLARRFL